MRHPDENIISCTCKSYPEKANLVICRKGCDLDLSELFPADKALNDYYTYTGSLDVLLPTGMEPITGVVPNYISEAFAEQIALWRSRYMSQ